ncbi:hypothetical protein PCE1_001991 [Barthelona sp. PCE]
MKDEDNKVPGQIKPPGYRDGLEASIDFSTLAIGFEWISRIAEGKMDSDVLFTRLSSLVALNEQESKRLMKAKPRTPESLFTFLSLNQVGNDFDPVRLAFDLFDDNGNGTIPDSVIQNFFGDLLKINIDKGILAFIKGELDCHPDEEVTPKQFKQYLTDERSEFIAERYDIPLKGRWNEKKAQKTETIEQTPQKPQQQKEEYSDYSDWSDML